MSFTTEAWIQCPHGNRNRFSPCVASSKLLVKMAEDNPQDVLVTGISGVPFGVEVQ